MGIQLGTEQNNEALKGWVILWGEIGMTTMLN